MKVVFVDTGAFYAAINQKDENHSEAAALFRRAIEEEWRLITSSFIVAETHALILTRMGRGLAMAWLRSIPARIVRISKADEEKARGIIFGYRDKSFSYCDASSFALIERLRIKEAMAFDSHFAQYGKFGLLRK